MLENASPYAKTEYFSSRFGPNEDRDRLWRVLAAYLQKEMKPDGDVLELGGGYCGFINNIRGASRHVVDLFEDLAGFAAPGVCSHVQSCTSLASFSNASFDTVFASNLFEHLTRGELVSTLSEVMRVLRPGGRLMLIQPNFRLCYATYFDDYTHVQIFSDQSLRDLLTSRGFIVKSVVAGFLPFSLKTRAPKWNWLLRLYLALPWRPFAGQMYIVAEKPVAKAGVDA
jgi:SAM-dependent methyltransferase